MNIIRMRVVLVVALSVMIFTSTVSILDSLEKAPSSFAAEGGFVITSPGAPTIFSSVVDQDLASAINTTIQPASPEIFAFSSYADVPFVVRGVEMALLNLTGPQFTKFVRTDGGNGLYGADALVGVHLMERLDIVPPCDMAVAASYSSRFEVLNVVGWFESQSPLDDELLVSLENARSLSGMSPGRVSIIRVAQVSDDLKHLTESQGARFAMFDFTASKARVAVGETVEVSAVVRNWGTERGQINLSFSYHLGGASGVLIGSETVVLDAGEERTCSASYSPDAEGSYVLRAGLWR